MLKATEKANTMLDKSHTDMFSVIYFKGVEGQRHVDHSTKLNQLDWNVRTINFGSVLVNLEIDPRIDEDLVIAAMKATHDFVVSASSIKRQEIHLRICYHKLQAGGVAANGSTDKILYTTIMINDQDALICEETLLHELVHFWDAATEATANMPHGTAPAVDGNKIFREASLLSTDYKKVMAMVDVSAKCIDYYTNDPSEMLVCAFFSHHDDDPNAVYECQGLSERVLSSIDNGYRAQYFTKKEAKRLMRLYIQLQKSSPKHKYLYHFARTLKAGKM